MNKGPQSRHFSLYTTNKMSKTKTKTKQRQKQNQSSKYKCPAPHKNLNQKEDTIQVQNQKKIKPEKTQHKYKSHTKTLRKSTKKTMDIYKNKKFKKQPKCKQIIKKDYNKTTNI